MPDAADSGLVEIDMRTALEIALAPVFPIKEILTVVSTRLARFVT